MTEKSNVEVIIGGKVLRMSGYESEAYMQKVASHINRRTQEIEETPEYRHLSPELKNLLIQINLVDDLMKAKERVEQLEADMELKENELSEVQHELVSAQIKLERLEGNRKR